MDLIKPSGLPAKADALGAENCPPQNLLRKFGAIQRNCAIASTVNEGLTPSTFNIFSQINLPDRP